MTQNKITVEQLFKLEGNSITNFFRANEIRAKVDWVSSAIVETGYFRYGLALDSRERFSRVESCQRELQTLLSNSRRSLGIVSMIGNKVIPFTLMPYAFPSLALETPHPRPVALTSSQKILFDGQPHTMALGRSYLPVETEEVGDLNTSPHYLVCGITSAGKSVLEQNMILSLAARTRPKDLKFVFIDLKNEDLAVLRKLPHVLTFAGDPEAALEALEWCNTEKEKRIKDPEYKPYRLAIFLDEMAHLASNSRAREILELLATIGRTKFINLVGATQHPTKEGGMGSLLKANFTERCVGQVAPGQSQYATNRPGTHAELLPGHGSFLRCAGASIYRFQSYYTPPDKIEEVVRSITKMHASMDRLEREAAERMAGRYMEQPVLSSVSGGFDDGFETGFSGFDTGFSGGFGGKTTTPTPKDTIASVKTGFDFFPIGEARKLNDAERKEFLKRVRNGVYDRNGKFSQNAALLAIYGSKNAKTISLIKEELG